MECYALNCRSDGGPKEAELKNIYKKCLKMQQEGNNSTKGNSEQDWKESRSQLHSNNWERGRMGNKENRNNRDDRMSSRDKMNTRDDMMGNNGDRMGGNNDRMGSKSGKMGFNSDRSGSSSDKMGSSSDRIGYSDRMGERKDRYGNTDNSRDERYDQNEYFNRREDFPQSGEYGTGMSQYSNHHSTTSPKRYKREKRPENSGQRSQYNPNTHKIKLYEDNFRSDEKNSTENNSSKEMDNKACALHCFMENLDMTGEDGMPDRYMVTHAITKDVKNEDLRDFLQESIEECFQILDNENSDDKCEFSKNLMLCLSEKGRANCDDWKDDLKF
ncbi:unnamed protein product [Arctia plantaginis]|uniref:Uncharacterized protein n=1 Tax=Arctia plantaginis TaxID=874455 RepID=A0A8S0Z9B0_ARCPL|nr:unnamed protein product [Arctia plantaginis]